MPGGARPTQSLPRRHLYAIAERCHAGTIHAGRCVAKSAGRARERFGGAAGRTACGARRVVRSPTSHPRPPAAAWSRRLVRMLCAARCAPQSDLQQKATFGWATPRPQRDRVKQSRQPPGSVTAPVSVFLANGRPCRSYRFARKPFPNDHPTFFNAAVQPLDRARDFISAADAIASAAADSAIRDMRGGQRIVELTERWCRLRACASAALGAGSFSATRARRTVHTNHKRPRLTTDIEPRPRRNRAGPQ